MSAGEQRFAIHGTDYVVRRMQLGPYRGSANGVLLYRQAMYWLAKKGEGFKVRVTYARW